MRLPTVLLLVAALLAGCTDPASTDLESQDADPGPDPTPEPTPDPGGNGTDPGPPAPEPNTPPTATLTADDADGDAPLNVTFTLDGADGDGDNLTWTFDRDDDGTIDDQGDSLPATLTYAYGAGDWTARLTVFDGEDEAEATLAVEAFEAEAPDPGPVQELSIGWPVGGTDLLTILDGAAQLCGSGLHDGILHASFEVAAASQGAPVAATISHGVASEGVIGWGILYLNGDCGESELIHVDGSGALSGTVPGFATWAIAYSDGGGQVEVEYTAG